MFADDTKLFLSRQNINTLFKIFNEELKDWGLIQGKQIILK